MALVVIHHPTSSRPKGMAPNRLASQYSYHRLPLLYLRHTSRLQQPSRQTRLATRRMAAAQQLIHRAHAKQI